jgi:hypothetical protein
VQGSRSARRGLAALVAVALALIVVAPTTLAAGAPAETQRTVERETFIADGFNPCNGENIFSMVVTLELTQVVVQDAAGGRRTDIRFLLHGSGVGEFGNRYVLQADLSNFVSSQLSSGVQDFTIASHVHVISLDGAPDYLAHANLQFTTLATGEITAYVTNLTADACGPPHGMIG